MPKLVHRLLLFLLLLSTQQFPAGSAVPGRLSSSRPVLETDSTTVFLSPSLIPSSIFVVDGLHLRLFIFAYGAKISQFFSYASSSTLYPCE